MMLSDDVLMTFPPLQVRTKGGGGSLFNVNDTEL